MLLGVPNLSEGRDGGLIERVGAQFAAGATLLDTHSDAVHNRSVLTLGGPSRGLGEALARGAGAAMLTIDMRRHEGAHPCIGALDVCPLVFLSAEQRGDAQEEAMRLARALGDGGVPVFCYGDLATAPERRERAFFRSGGLARLAQRMESGELVPDFGPPAPHPSAGATLVTARPPLAAFNLVLEGADMDAARGIAAALREAGGGPVGVRAMAVDLGDGGPQISTNVHDPVSVPLVAVVERVRELATDAGAGVVSGEVVGLVAEAALEGLPQDLELPGFDPERQVIERALDGRSPRDG